MINNSKIGIKGFTKLYFYKNNYFYNLTLESCYWAGFIAADGYMRKNKKTICITLSLKDKNHLIKFSKAVSGRNLVKTYDNYCSLEITSKGLYNSLNNIYNIYSKKSFSYSPPTNLSAKKTLAFLKGYLDGDGCFHLTKSTFPSIHIVGSQNTVKWIKKQLINLVKLDITHLSIRNNKSIKQFTISGKNAIIAYNTLKKIKTPELERKWNKFEVFK
jgi:hypothetical protein